MYRPDGVMNAKYQCDGTGPREGIVVNKSTIYWLKCNIYFIVICYNIIIPVRLTLTGY